MSGTKGLRKQEDRLRHTEYNSALWLTPQTSPSLPEKRKVRRDFS